MVCKHMLQFYIHVVALKIKDICNIWLKWYNGPGMRYWYGKCSKISNTLKLRTPKIIAENNF